MLADTFIANYRAVAGVPHLADDPQEAAAIIIEIMREHAVERGALALLPEAWRAPVSRAVEHAGILLMQPPYDAAALPGSLDAVQCGITAAEFGIAQTGTLVEVATEDSQRLVSSLPRLHIGLVHERHMIPTLLQAGPRLRGLFQDHNRNVAVSFISGPSRTGDIEMKLTLGVHGPEFAHVIIITGPDYAWPPTA